MPTAWGFCLSFLIFIAFSESKASDSTSLVGTAVGTGTGAATTANGQAPYFYGTLTALECNGSSGNTCWFSLVSSTSGSNNMTSPNTAYTASNNPNNFVNYSNIPLNCSSNTNCLQVPVYGIYRVTLNFDAINNNPNHYAQFFVGVEQWWPQYEVNTSYVAQPYWGWIVLGTTSLLQGHFFHQSLTNTLIMNPSNTLQAYVSTADGNTDVVITGGSLEVQLIGYLP